MKYFKGRSSDIHNLTQIVQKKLVRVCVCVCVCKEKARETK
jgi:hypothetical protein